MTLHKRRMGDKYSGVRVLDSPFAQRPFVESPGLGLLCHDPSWYVHREEYVCRTCKFEHCPNLTMRSVDRIEKVMLTGSTLFSESRRYPAASHHVPIRPRTVQCRLWRRTLQRHRVPVRSAKSIVAESQAPAQAYFGLSLRAAWLRSATKWIRVSMPLLICGKSVAFSIRFTR